MGKIVSLVPDDVLVTFFVRAAFFGLEVSQREDLSIDLQEATCPLKKTSDVQHREWMAIKLIIVEIGSAIDLTDLIDLIDLRVHFYRYCF